MRITARVDYAVRAALELAAAAPEALTADRIATAQGIPSRFLQAILGDLQRGHLVTSQRGRDGGYRLALPSEISIARVMRIEQGFLAEVHGQRPEDVVYPAAAAELASVCGRAGGLPPRARAGHARRRRRRQAARPGRRTRRPGRRLAVVRRRARQPTSASGTLTTMSAPRRTGVTVFLTGLSGRASPRSPTRWSPSWRPTASGDGPGRRRRPHPPVQRADVLPRAPRPQHPADRLGRRRGVRHGGTVVVAAIAPYEAAREEARRWWRSTAGSCSCTWPPRSRSASSGTSRAVRQGSGRRDPRVHRRERPLRAAGPRRGRHRHVGTPLEESVARIRAAMEA